MKKNRKSTCWYGESQIWQNGKDEKFKEEDQSKCATQEWSPVNLRFPREQEREETRPFTYLEKGQKN